MARSQFYLADVVDEEDGSAMVRLCRVRRPNVELVMPDRAAARELVHALGLAHDQIRSTFFTASPVHATRQNTFGLVVVVLCFVLAAPLSMVSVLATRIAVVVVVLFLALWLALARTQVEVGSDGVMIRWLKRERFVPFSNLAAVQLVDSDAITASLPYAKSGDEYGAERRGSANWFGYRRESLRLVLEDGGEVVVPTLRLAPDASRALVQRIRERKEAFDRSDGDEVLALPVRGQQSHSAWVDALRARAVSAQHRVLALTNGGLWGVIRDASRDELQRAMAAVALGANCDGADRRRLAEVAQTTVSPKLRVVLDTVSQEAELELQAEALRDLERAASRAANS